MNQGTMGRINMPQVSIEDFKIKEPIFSTVRTSMIIKKGTPGQSW